MSKEEFTEEVYTFWREGVTAYARTLGNPIPPIEFKYLPAPLREVWIQTLEKARNLLAANQIYLKGI